MGTGTVGSGHHSHQTDLGVKGLSDLLLNGYDQGLRFFDAADSYGSHPHVAEALKHVPRDKVTVLTKTLSRDAASARADLDRFRRELGTDYLDICLMHCVTEGDWTDRYPRRPGRALRSQGERNHPRPRLLLPHASKPCAQPRNRRGWKSTWPASTPSARIMDADPATVVGVLKEMKAAGKAVIGMKILGQGAPAQPSGRRHQVRPLDGVLDAFTIGAESKHEQEDLIRRIAAA